MWKSKAIYFFNLQFWFKGHIFAGERQGILDMQTLNLTSKCLIALIFLAF
jgi:hypothetical protein